MLLLVALALGANAAQGAEPYLVRDINQVPTPAQSFPGSFGAFGGVAIFAANVGDERELWRSDGTEAGTYQLLDACPGHCSSNPRHLVSTPLGSFFFTAPGGSVFADLWITRGNPGDTVRLASRVGVGLFVWRAWVPELGKVFFAAVDDDAGMELWVSDGTPGGTHVLDVLPGPDSSDPTWPVAFRGRLFFLANFYPGGRALWTSDGTAAGTRLVRQSVADPATVGVATLLTVVGKRLVFFAPAVGKGLELWKSDGTTAGTTLLVDIARGQTSVTPLAVNAGGGRAFLAVETAKGGQELWVTDGTPKGTRQLTFFQPAKAFTQPGEILGWFGGFAGGRFVFDALDGVHGYEPWVSDGTVKGTRLLADVCPGSCDGRMIAVGAVGPRLVFDSYDSEHGSEPWITDGTKAGTRLLADLCTGSCGTVPRSFGALAGRLLFVTHGDGSAHLRITDGTAAGTVDLGATLPVPPRGLEYFVDGSRAFFAGADTEHGSEPWTSDGTIAGTHRMRDVDDVELSHSRPGFFHTVGDRLYFFADDGTSGFEPWTSDGTEAGTRRIADIVPGEHPGNPPSHEMAAVLGSSLLFTRFGEEVHELWRTDGSAAGTFRVTAEPMWTRELATAGNLGFFTAANEVGLWRTDGTVAGTAQVVDNPARAERLSGWNGTLFFSADSEVGDELWKSDGTAAGTVLVKDIVPGHHSSSPAAFAAGPAGLYFLTGSTRGLAELWRTDGTAAGTQRLAELVGEGHDGGLRSRIVPLGALTFVFTRGSVWVSDGTEAGTRRLEAVVGSMRPDETPPIAFGGAVYFSGPGPLSAPILWRSDGTDAGTYPLLDAAGETLEWPASLRVFAGRLAFAASQGDSFLWTSDGTSAGTRKVFPLRTVWGGREELAVAGARLYFTPASREHGQELWALPAD